MPHEVGAVSEQDLDRLHSLEHEIDRRLFISNNGQNSWQSDRRRRFLPRLVRKRLKKHSSLIKSQFTSSTRLKDRRLTTGCKCRDEQRGDHAETNDTRS